jgi:murein DD-endopeptidase MepM/ murein hydrolase activator NlpD
MRTPWLYGLPLLALLPGCIPRAEPPGGAPAPQSTTWRDEAPAPIHDRPPDDRRRVADADQVRAANETSRRGEVTVPAPSPFEAGSPEREAAPTRDRPFSAPARQTWDVRPVTPQHNAVPAARITARVDDTLARIAARTGAGAGAIARANDLQPPFTVQAGQQIEIPGGNYHVVRSGDAGIAIARAYGIAWSRIVDANALAEPFVLRVGQRILIPGGNAPGVTTAAERAAAFTLDVDDILTGGEPALAMNQAPSRPVATSARVLPATAQVAAPARLRGGFAWPVAGNVVTRFGHGASGERNDGIGIAVPIGTPVHAAADGVVAYAGTGVAALGGLVIIRHGEGWTTVYGHAAKLLVRRGQAVTRGQTIALSGDTGSADRPELHFELRKGRTPVDPATELPAR